MHTITTNIRGTEIVLDLCARFDKRVLLASTRRSTATAASPSPLHEDDRRVYGPTTDARWAYAATKEIDEFLALAWHRRPGSRSSWPGCSTPSARGRAGVTAWCCRASSSRRSAGEPIEVHGDGQQTRCFLDVEDCVRALTGARWAPPRPPAACSTSAPTARSPSASSRSSCASAPARASAVRLVPYEEAYGPGFEDMLHRRPAIDRIADTIGWRPRVTLEETVDRAIASRVGRGAGDRAGMTTALTLVLALAVALVLTPAVARLPGLVAVPLPDRWHARTTPVTGGIALVVAFLVALPARADRRRGAVALPAPRAARVRRLRARAVGRRALAAAAGEARRAAGHGHGGRGRRPVPGLAARRPWPSRWRWSCWWRAMNSLNLLDHVDGLAAGTAAIAALALAGRGGLVARPARRWCRWPWPARASGSCPGTSAAAVRRSCSWATRRRTCSAPRSGAWRCCRARAARAGRRGRRRARC